MLVRNGPHDAAHGEAVEVVVDENQHAQEHGGQLGPDAAFNMVLGPAAEGGGAARLVHQAHHGAQDNQEDQDAHVVGIGDGGHDAVVEHMEDSGLKGEAGVQQAAHQDP